MPATATLSKAAIRRANASVKFSISPSGMTPVHVPVLGRERGRDVIPTEQNLQRATAADQASEPRHGTATGDCVDAYFELAQDRFLRRKADVSGEHELAARAAGAAPDLRDGRHR
jgi:hypothetical protein